MMITVDNETIGWLTVILVSVLLIADPVSVLKALVLCSC